MQHVAPDDRIQREAHPPFLLLLLLLYPFLFPGSTLRNIPCGERCPHARVNRVKTNSSRARWYLSFVCYPHPGKRWDFVLETCPDPGVDKSLSRGRRNWRGRGARPDSRHSELLRMYVLRESEKRNQKKRTSHPTSVMRETKRGRIRDIQVARPSLCCWERTSPSLAK